MKEIFLCETSYKEKDILKGFNFSQTQVYTILFIFLYLE